VYLENAYDQVLAPNTPGTLFGSRVVAYVIEDVVILG
jgi:hypothetical protein